MWCSFRAIELHPGSENLSSSPPYVERGTTTTIIAPVIPHMTAGLHPQSISTIIWSDSPSTLQPGSPVPLPKCSPPCHEPLSSRTRRLPVVRGDHDIHTTKAIKSMCPSLPPVRSSTTSDSTSFVRMRESDLQVGVKLRMNVLVGLRETVKPPWRGGGY